MRSQVADLVGEPTHLTTIALIVSWSSSHQVLMKNSSVLAPEGTLVKRGPISYL